MLDTYNFKGKREITKGIELLNQESIITIGAKRKLLITKNIRSEKQQVNEVGIKQLEKKTKTKQKKKTTAKNKQTNKPKSMLHLYLRDFQINAYQCDKYHHTTSQLLHPLLKPLWPRDIRIANLRTLKYCKTFDRVQRRYRDILKHGKRR